MRNEILPYNPKLKSLARQLRKNSTMAEVLLWRHLKGKACGGADFHRQKPIGNYIVDFFCPRLKLAVEIDGVSHDAKPREDIIRQRQLEDAGVVFLRFADRDVKNNLAAVVAAIEQWIISREPNPPRRYAPPLPRGE